MEQVFLHKRFGQIKGNLKNVSRENGWLNINLSEPLKMNNATYRKSSSMMIRIKEILNFEKLNLEY